MNVYRLEASGIDPDLSEGLAARVADPLWYLTRQWQAGEFRGEDAATPMIVDLEIDVYKVTEARTGRLTHQIDASSPPLEALVEQEHQLPRLTYRDRLESALTLLTMLTTAGHEKYANALRGDRGLQFNLPRTLDDGDPVGTQRLRILAQNGFDAGRLITRIQKAGGTDQAAPFAGAPAAVIAVVDTWLATETALVQGLANTTASAWLNERQEYRFGISAKTGGNDPLHLVAPEYPGGRLDWYHFDLLKADSPPGRMNRLRKRVLVTPLVFAGQPAQRFWEFEEGDAYFGGLAGGEGDLARSVLAAYAAVAGDDWYVVPAEVPANSLVRVAALNVFDNFGPLDEKGNYVKDSWRRVPATAKVDMDAGERVWRWQEIDGTAEADPDGTPLVFIPPVLASTRHGPILEEVRFRRDEGANLVWAIEAKYQGAYRRAVERARPPETAPPVPAIDGDWTYQLGTSVPAHWLPMVPVRITGNSPQTILRRGRMAIGAGQDESEARGTLLMPGQRFLLEENEVPDGGIRTTRRYQMSRNASGGVTLWVGKRKGPASGPLPHSALEFDALKGWRKKR